MKAISILIMLVLATGCSHRTGQSWGGGSEGVSQSSTGKAMDFSVEYLTHNGRNYLVLAVEGCVKTSQSTGPAAQGMLFTADNRQINWSCTTSDGKTGNVVIDGKDFDLAKGGLLIVSIGGDQPAIEQVPTNMAKLQGGNVTMKLKELEKSEPRIAEFWKKVGKIE